MTSGNDKARLQIIKEIRDTEQRYLEALSLLSKEYISPIVEKKLLTNTLITDLFAMLGKMINFHMDLLKQLKRSDDVGQTFLTMIPFLTTYSDYFHCHEKVIELVESSTDTKFKQWLQKKEDQLLAKSLQTLAGYLIMPIQRIPRYSLLLKELQKNTSSQHPDFVNIKSALEGSQAVASFLNKGLNDIIIGRKKEEFMKRIPESKRSEFSDLSWVHEGWLIVSETTLTVIKKNLFCVLFNDILICTETTSDTAPLDIIVKINLATAKKTERTNIVFQILTDDDNTYDFKCPDENALNTWHTFIVERIKKRYVVNTETIKETKVMTTTTRAEKWKGRKTSLVVSGSSKEEKVNTPSLINTTDPLSTTTNDRQVRRATVTVSNMVTRRSPSTIDK